MFAHTYIRAHAHIHTIHVAESSRLFDDLRPPPTRARPPRISLKHQPIFILGSGGERRGDVGRVDGVDVGRDGAYLGTLLRCSEDNGASASGTTR